MKTHNFDTLLQEELKDPEFRKEYDDFKANLEVA